MERLKDKGAVVASVFVAIFVVGWSVIALAHIGAPVELASDGKTVLRDQWSRAISVFTAALPLLTTVVGFWVGAQGKAKAEQKADEAQANEKALAAASTPEILQRAQQAYGYQIRGEVS